MRLKPEANDFHESGGVMERRHSRQGSSFVALAVAGQPSALGEEVSEAHLASAFSSSHASKREIFADIPWFRTFALRQHGARPQHICPWRG